MRGGDFASEVKLGVAHEVVGMLMPPILRGFRRAYPNVLLTLVSDSTQVLRGRLHEAEVDLALLTEPEPGRPDELLLADELVWDGAPEGDAYSRCPLSVAICNEVRCGVRSSAIDALNRAGVPWRPIVHLGNLEPVFATLEADMAVSIFLAQTVPERLVILEDHGLPPLPLCHINLRQPPVAVGPVACELARHIREGFAQHRA